MGKPDYDAIEKRHEKASDGPSGLLPWEARTRRECGEGHTCYEVVMELPKGSREKIAQCMNRPNAEFIAAARADVPALLSRCRALEAALKTATDEWGAHLAENPAAWKIEHRSLARCRSILAGTDQPESAPAERWRCKTCGGARVIDGGPVDPATPSVREPIDCPVCKGSVTRG